MTAAIIVSIVTAALSFAVSAVSIILGIFNNKNSNILAITTQGRVNNLSGMREGFTELTGLVDLDAIKYSSTHEIKDFAYPVALSKARSRFHKHIRPIYFIDVKLLKMADDLCVLCMSAYNKKGEISEEERAEFMKAKNDFESAFSTYDWAYWEYIQEQAKGTKYNSGVDFNMCYKSFIERLKEGKEESVLTVGNLYDSELKI